VTPVPPERRKNTRWFSPRLVKERKRGGRLTRDQNNGRVTVERLDVSIRSIQVSRDLKASSVRLAHPRETTSEAIFCSDEEDDVGVRFLVGGGNRGDGERVSFEGC